MIFINPWSYYQIHETDKIPDLNPRDNEEIMGCLAGTYGFIVSTIIYMLLCYLCFNLTKGLLRPILIMINSVIIYPILTICLMKLSFKIGDKIYKKKRK